MARPRARENNYRNGARDIPFKELRDIREGREREREKERMPAFKRGENDI